MLGSISVLPGFAPDHLERLLDEMTADASGALAVNFLTDDVDPKAVELAAGGSGSSTSSGPHPTGPSSTSDTPAGRSSTGRSAR